MRPAPRLVALRGGLDASALRPPVLLCGHCAQVAPPAAAPGALPGSRVCRACRLGLVILVEEHLAPTPKDAFLLIDRSLQVSAVSRRAEVLLQAEEVALVGRRLGDVLVPADVGLTPQALAARVVAAAEGDDAVQETVVRPPGEFGVRWWARVGRCGPPAAALVVLAAR